MQPLVFMEYSSTSSRSGKPFLVFVLVWICAKTWHWHAILKIYWNQFHQTTCYLQPCTWPWAMNKLWNNQMDHDLICASKMWRLQGNAYIVSNFECRDFPEQHLHENNLAVQLPYDVTRDWCAWYESTHTFSIPVFIAFLKLLQNGTFYDHDLHEVTSYPHDEVNITL